MLGDRCGYPWVSQLQEQGTAGSKEYRRLSVEAPGHRVGAE